jgi:hypothetical protein
MLLNIHAVSFEEIFHKYLIDILGVETFPDLTYTVQMRRRPLFYVFNMILPCFLITTVAFLGFCVPSDSGWLDDNFLWIDKAGCFFFYLIRRKSFNRSNNTSFNDSFSYACC